MTLKSMTGAQAGLVCREQIRIALTEIERCGGTAEMVDIYEAVERHMHKLGATLNQQGKATLRSLVNRDAVAAGFLEREPEGGWRLLSRSVR